MPNSIYSISPLDGRYFNQINELSTIVSEYGLIKYRLIAEIKWLIKLLSQTKLTQFDLTDEHIIFLNNIIENFNQEEALKVKDIEKTTNHDVKALEYYIQNQLKSHPTLAQTIHWIHFACTSEDINNIAHAFILKNSIKIMSIEIQQIINTVKSFAHQNANLVMMSRTHGQPATPTTLGKEFANFAYRLENAHKDILNCKIKGKFNGAVGNYNAHFSAFEDFDWQNFNQDFVQSLGFEFNPYTTQIENHDYMSALFDSFVRFNNILIDFNRDIWSYISIEYLTQIKLDNEVGSSTMPHKINPINFENSEGNLGLANVILIHLSNKLPISRMQRDLTDSTVLRNIGVGLGYSLLAYKNCIKGLQKITPNQLKMQQELEQNLILLAEPIQTILRKYGIENAYEILKDFTRGQQITEQKLSEFISNLDINDQAKAEISKLSISKYIGLAEKLAQQI